MIRLSSSSRRYYNTHLFSYLNYVDELPSPPKSFEVTDMEGFDANDTLPTVLITILVRNKAHTLPYFFGCLENLSYPKEKISLFIRSDHNVDKSNGMERPNSASAVHVFILHILWYLYLSLSMSTV